MRRLIPPVSMFCLCILVGQSPAADQTTLDVAKKLAQDEYRGWTYGIHPDEKQIDCVTFLLKVVETKLGKPLDAPTRKCLLIIGLTDVQDAVAHDDPRIQGVYKALIDSGLGQSVTPNDAVSGDLIQYWEKKANGNWEGHCGILDAITKTNSSVQSTIYSASQSSNGIGPSPVKLRLDAQDGRKVFIVRLKPVASDSAN